MNKSITFLFTLLFSFSAQGAPQVELLKCPAIPESYLNALTKLNVIKTAIKEEAACKPITREVESLEALLGERREVVDKLIEKNKKEPLDADETKKIREYVEDVTKKVFSTTELIKRSEYCFDEDRKEFGLSEMASITLDATAAAKSVAGPWAAPIVLGGQILAGIFQGLDAMFGGHAGYDFDKLEQRQSFVQSLCTYYNYRQDIEYLLYPKHRLTQLRELKRNLEKNRDSLATNCELCRRISELAKRNFSIDPGVVQQINQLAATADSAYEQPLGSYLIQTLSSLSWVEEEVKRVQMDLADEASIGRDFISEVRADIDEFLFENEAPRFLNFQTKKALDLHGDFRSFVKEEGRDLLLEAGGSAGISINKILRADEMEIIQMMNQVAKALESQQESSVYHRIVDFQRNAEDLAERTQLAADVRVSYCRFFQKAGLYNSSLRESCETNYIAKLLNSTLEKLKLLDKPVVGGSSMVGAYQVELVIDWADGLNKMVNQLAQDPSLYKTK